MARHLAAALALLLLAASCGGREDTNDVVTGTTSTLATGDVDTTSAPTDSPSTGAGSGGPATTRGSRPNTTIKGGSPNTPSTKGAIDDAADSPVGGFARTLLADGPAQSLVLDVRVGDGVTPDGDALNTVAQLLRTFSGKPVSVGGPTALRGVSGGRHTAKEIRSLAAEQGTPNRDGVAVVHLLYLAGTFEQDGVLGVAVRGDTLALFGDEMDSSTSPFVTRARIERAVLTHEIGHLLGLVDLVVDDNRDDPDHPGHSRNRGSVMFWAVETSLVGQVLGGPPPVDFDAEDVADLREIRSGG